MAITQDHAIVDNIPHAYQFTKGNSLYRCVAFVLAALSAFAYPKKFAGANLNTLASGIYQHYAGQDIDTNTNGLTKEQAVDYLNAAHIGYVDLQHLVDQGGDYEALRLEMAAMNRQGVPQLLTIADESHLHYAPNGQKLHNWNDAGLSHCIVRLGMDEHDTVGYYLDPAAPVPPFTYPTPIKWEDIVACRPITALGIMPPGVEAPPAGFSYQNAKWPTPEPVVNLDNAASTLHSISSAMDQLQNAIAAVKAASANALHDLGK